MPSRSTYLPNLTGHTIDHGMLKLVKRMGRGAFGQVYKAENFGSSGPSFYAVKCLQRTAHGSRDAKMQERERRFHLRVSAHANIVTFYGTLLDQEHRFFVLELCAGSDMHDAIIRGVYHRKTDMIKRVFAAAIDAILFCHSHGIYHRDLKPENILVDSDGENPRIADFGLSTDQRVSHEMSCGSPSYMPPESFASASSFYRPADNDTWALCIVLLNMLASMNPWHGAEPSDARWNAFMADPDYLRGISPISRSLNDYLKQCFRVDPTSRPSLLEVKDAVSDMRHLYMSDADFKVARYSVQRIAEGAAFGENIPYQRSACSHCGGHADASDSGSSGYSSATRVERPITFLEDDGTPPKTMPGASHLAVPGHTLSHRKAPVSSRPSSNAIFAPRVHDVSPMASSLEDQLEVIRVIIASEPKASRSKLKGFMHRLRVWRK